MCLFGHRTARLVGHRQKHEWVAYTGTAREAVLITDLDESPVILWHAVRLVAQLLAHPLNHTDFVKVVKVHNGSVRAGRHRSILLHREGPRHPAALKNQAANSFLYQTYRAVPPHWNGSKGRSHQLARFQAEGGAIHLLGVGEHRQPLIRGREEVEGRLQVFALQVGYLLLVQLDGRHGTDERKGALLTFQGYRHSVDGTQDAYETLAFDQSSINLLLLEDCPGPIGDQMTHAIPRDEVIVNRFHDSSLVGHTTDSKPFSICGSHPWARRSMRHFIRGEEQSWTLARCLPQVSCDRLYRRFPWPRPGGGNSISLEFFHIFNWSPRVVKLLRCEQLPGLTQRTKRVYRQDVVVHQFT